MTAEAAKNVERFSREDDPTALSLFRFPSEQLPGIIAHFENASQFRTDFAVLQQTYAQLEVASLAQEARLQTRRDTSSETLRDKRKSMTVSQAYYLFTESVAEKGGSPQDCMEFFLSCLAINHKVPRAIASQALRTRVEAALPPLLQGPSARKAGIDTMFNKLVANQPVWFKGNKTAWTRYAARHAIFAAFIQHGFLTLCETSPDTLPDWLTQKDIEPPTREAAKKEFLADNAFVKQIALQDELIAQRLNQPQNIRDSLFQQVGAFIEEQRRVVFPRPQSFPQLLIAIEATHNVAVYTDSPEKIRTQPVTTTLQHRTLPQQVRQNTINEFVAALPIRPSTEVLALFLENQFLYTEIFHNPQEPINDNQINAFQLCIDSLNSSKVQAHEMYEALTDHFGDTHYVLEYTLSPLVSLLSKTEREKLKLGLQEKRGKPFETALWEITKAIVEAVGKHKGNLPANAKKVIEEMQTFATRWIDTYAPWYWYGLEEELMQKSKKEEPTLSLHARVHTAEMLAATQLLEENI